MEIIIVAIITTIGMFISILLLDHSFFRRLKWKQDFEMAMLKVKKKEMRKDRQIANSIKTKAPTGKIENLINMVKLLDNEGLQDLLGLLPKGVAEGVEGEGGILDVIIDYAEDNPDIVKKFVEGLTGGGKKESDVIYER